MNNPGLSAGIAASDLDGEVVGACGESPKGVAVGPKHRAGAPIEGPRRVRVAAEISVYAPLTLAEPMPGCL